MAKWSYGLDCSLEFISDNERRVNLRLAFCKTTCCTSLAFFCCSCSLTNSSNRRLLQSSSLGKKRLDLCRWLFKNGSCLPSYLNNVHLRLDCDTPKHSASRKCFEAKTQTTWLDNCCNRDPLLLGTKSIVGVRDVYNEGKGVSRKYQASPGYKGWAHEAMVLVVQASGWQESRFWVSFIHTTGK